MKKLATQLIKELTSLSDAIPEGFKGFFAKSGGLFWKNSDGTEKQVATADHNHTLASLSEKSYNSLTEKPTIPAAQIPTDWNATGSNSLVNKYGFIEDYPESIQAFEGKVYLKINSEWKFFPNLELRCVKSVKSNYGTRNLSFNQYEFATELLYLLANLNFVFKAFRIEWYSTPEDNPVPSSYFKANFVKLLVILKKAFEYFYANLSNPFTIHIYDIVDKNEKCGEITFGNMAYGMLTERCTIDKGVATFNNYATTCSPFNTLAEWLLNHFFSISSPTADDSIITTRRTMKIGKQPKRNGSTWFRSFDSPMYDITNNQILNINEASFICGDPILIRTEDGLSLSLITTNIFAELKDTQLTTSSVLIYPIQSVSGYVAFYYAPVGVDGIKIKNVPIIKYGHYSILVTVYRKNRRPIEVVIQGIEVAQHSVSSVRAYLKNNIWYNKRSFNQTTKVTFSLINETIGYKTLESDRYLVMDRNVESVPWALLPARK